MKNRAQNLLVVLGVPLLILVLLFAAVNVTGYAPVQAKEIGDVVSPGQGQVTVLTSYSAGSIAGTTTTYSTGQDSTTGVGLAGGAFQRYKFIDVFVRGTVVAAQAATVTLQFSPDNTNWADASHLEVLNNVSTEVPYRALMAAGTSSKMFTAPVLGVYFRYKIEHSGAVTPTIVTVGRN